ncbi:MAG TPA: sugar transferase [Sedimentisphaerales bacterium]|nr:sugar transferase [Sedimentisphaerales bacterium]
MRLYPPAKRLFDLFISLFAAIVLLPMMILIVIAIRLSSRGPAVFVQERAGKDAKPFRMYKFRTMRSDVEAFGPSPRSGDDPRLTRIGRLLRETSLDELPQLLNIIKGEMALVGPRPLYVAQIAEWNDREKQRLLVKPGITGLAQVSGRGGLTREEKLELDVRYVETADLLTDLKILLATVAQVFGRTSIYEKKYSRTEQTRQGRRDGG